ncbi:O-antigen ligase family protein [Ancylobacter sonchi]|uniref:O-antigen ligase family protein n=1 Tax=Ancylobacter sonchi TaxID=1937790 RepID=UPI001BD586AB|nr:O-antigen ligase family protein [Ancylobacter sonchi]MBS7536707.1 O-antigen ligase family protein [Ancylobacter sonchi]
MLALLIYASGSAIILPRLFAGMTGAFVPVDGLVSEVPLAPVSGNIAQSGYFVLGGFIFFSLTLLLLARSGATQAKIIPHAQERNNDEYLLLRAIGKGFFFWTWLNAATGVLDLASKLAGGGDVLLPLRTAGYALLTETEHAGFWRITGLHPEASAFGAAALAGLAFSFTYWRATRSGNALILAIALLSLTLLSTSSTAYAGLAVLVMVAFLAAIRSLLRGRLLHTDATWLGAVLIAVTVILALVLINDEAFAKVETLLRATILEKSNSSSGIERAYWNQRSLDSFFTTSTFGIGLGSSRASSWAIAALSQLGLIGSMLLGFLMVTIAWSPHRGEWGNPPLGSEPRNVIALHDGVRAAALTSLLAATIGGGAADPGVLFFISLATLYGCRRYLQRQRRPSTGLPPTEPIRKGSVPQENRYDSRPGEGPLQPATAG